MHNTRRGEFKKIEFLDQIESICQRTFKQSPIGSAFRATGLISFDPSIVISKLREAVPASTLPNSEIPGSDFAASGSIPLAIATLRAQGQELLQCAKDMLPDFQRRLKQVLQGGLALAQSGELAKEHLANTQAAE